jgi:oligosaccharyltransferase complex subunit beta
LRLQVPDVYGVFKYVLDYHHAGYSYINLSQQVLADLSNMLHV